MKIFYSPKCLKYSSPGHPESPARVNSTHRFLADKGYSFAEPSPCSDDDILLAHSPELLARVRGGSFYDLDTPSLPNIFEYARLSAGSAIAAAMHCLSGEKAFSLMRPPGHHATKNDLGGFCYFNNIAIASLRAKEKVSKVAIIDFDCHHGNGTEDIFLGKKDFLYLSLHQSPLYPGTGLQSRDNCINIPLPADTTPEEYLYAFKEGLDEVSRFDPDMLAVSAGFDSYRLDPITNLSLEKETYRTIGEMIAGLDKPTFSILEGGYSKELADCVYQYLIGLEG
ncbi:MAG: histone deacetylase [Thermodesulfovibrionia bacterium]|nr:histone deacetylase [Thermodesulfovibrionia bacterium]